MSGVQEKMKRIAKCTVEDFGTQYYRRNNHCQENLEVKVMVLLLQIIIMIS